MNCLNQLSVARLLKGLQSRFEPSETFLRRSRNRRNLNRGLQKVLLCTVRKWVKLNRTGVLVPPFESAPRDLQNGHGLAFQGPPLSLFLFLFSFFFLIVFKIFWIRAFSCNPEIWNSSDGLVCLRCFVFDVGSKLEARETRTPEIQLPLDHVENQTMSIL